MLSAMSLVLSMTLCFVPKFKAQFESVKEAQAGIGRDTVAGQFVEQASLRPCLLFRYDYMVA